MGEQSSGDTWKLLVNLVTVIGGILGALSLWEGRQTRKIAEDANAISHHTEDRSCGKLSAKPAITGFVPQLAEIPASMKFHAPPGSDFARFESIAQLNTVNFRIIVQNTGEEVIDGLRIETTLDKVAFDLSEKKEEGHWFLADSWYLKQPKVEDHQLNRKLRPGEKAIVPLARGIVSQIMTMQKNGPSGRDYFGRFEIRCYGRAAGGIGFDPVEHHTQLVLPLVWSPDGFSTEKCQTFLETFQPLAEILDRK